MTEDSVVGTGDQLGTVGLMLTVMGLGVGLAVAAEPSGAGAAAALIAATVVDLNVRDPAPYLAAHNGWNELQTTFLDMSGKLSRLTGDVGDKWQGEAADSFTGFIERHIVPAIDALAECAKSAAVACSSLFQGMLEVIVAYLVATGSAIIACVAANASGPFSPAVKWGIIGGWMGCVLGIIGALVAFFTSMLGATDSLGDSYNSLVKAFGVEAGTLDTKSVSLPEPERLLFSDPQKWNKQKGE